MRKRIMAVLLCLVLTVTAAAETGPVTENGSGAELASVTSSVSAEVSVTDATQVLLQDPDGLLANCKTVLLATYHQNGKLTRISEGQLSKDTVHFKTALEERSVLFFLDDQLKPVCQNVEVSGSGEVGGDDVSSFVYIDNYVEGAHLRKIFIADAYFTDGSNSEITVGKIDGCRIGSDELHEIDRYRARYLWNDADLEQVGGRIPSNQQYAHWFIFTGSGSGEYTLRTPRRNRYDEPQSALTKQYDGEGELTLIKNGTANFMSGMAGDGSTKQYMDMYKLQYDTDPEKRLDSKYDTYGGVALDDITNRKMLTASETYDELNSVRGNANTIFVIKDENGEVNAYTGIANVPTVVIGAGHTGGAKVSWINRKDTNYASHVFVDVFNTGAATVGDGISFDMFTLKDTMNRTYVDGMDYLKYEVIIDGREEERWISSKLLDGNDEGKFFKNVKEDRNGRIISGKEVNQENGNKQRRVDVDWTAPVWTGMDSTITGRDSVLSILTGKDKLVNSASYAINCDAYVNDLYANSESNINLVVRANDDPNSKIADFLYDYGADYEVHQNVSVNYIAGMLKNYRLKATVYLVVTEENGDVIDTLWIHLTDAREKDDLDDTCIADYVFTLKATNNRTYVDGEDYFKYTVWIDGKEEERWISSRLVSGDRSDEGVLFRNIKMDSNGRIIGGKEVNQENGSRQRKADIDWTDPVWSGMDSTIAQKGNALSILTNGANKLVNNAAYATDNDTVFVNDLYVNSKANINLVVADDGSDNNVDVLLRDKGSDYEVHNMVSARYVAGMLENYRLEATLYLVVTEEDGDVIDTFWIYVTDVREKNKR